MIDVASYIVLIILALVPPLLFTVLYWKWIPSWTKNPYGRLAQSDPFSQIVILVMLLVFVGTDLSISEKRVVLSFWIVPLIFLGVYRLRLLKRTVDSSKVEHQEEEEKTSA